MAISATIAAVGTAVSIQQNAQARKEQRKAERARKRIADRQNQREKVSQLRQAQVARAEILAAGAMGGTQDSSSIQGSVASIGSQAAGNISFINQIASDQERIMDAQQKAAEFASNSRAVSQITGVATDVSLKTEGFTKWS